MTYPRQYASTHVTMYASVSVGRHGPQRGIFVDTTIPISQPHLMLGRAGCHGVSLCPAVELMLQRLRHDCRQRMPESPKRLNRTQECKFTIDPKD